MSLHTYLAAACGDMVGLPDYLDHLDHLDHLDTATRLREVRSLGERDQVKLFEAAAGERGNLPKYPGECPWL
jgi:hypothetical protein